MQNFMGQVDYVVKKPLYKLGNQPHITLQVLPTCQDLQMSFHIKRRMFYTSEGL